MDMQGETRIPASREAVWEALNDPEVLKACIPGCESLERTEDGGFEATVKAKVGPVKATFKGSVRLENINAPESYTIVGEGKGGAAGFAKGGADVSLAEEGNDTVLSYTVNAQVGGKLAQIGARLIDSTAKKYANDFFGTFSEMVSAGQLAPAAVAEPVPAPANTEPAAEPDPAAVAAERRPVTYADLGPTQETAEEDTAANDADPQADAARAAIEATDKVKASRGLGPFTWVLIIILIGLGAALLSS